MNINHEAFAEIISEFEKDFLKKEKIYSDEDLVFSMKKVSYVYSTKNGLEFIITLNKEGNEDE